MLKGFYRFEEPGSSAFLVLLWLNQSFFSIKWNQFHTKNFRSEPVKNHPVNVFLFCTRLSWENLKLSQRRWEICLQGLQWWLHQPKVVNPCILQNPRLCSCIKKTFFFFRGIYYHLTRTRCGIGRLDPSESRIVDVKSENKQSISACNEESISNENQSFIACREKSICNEMIPLSEDEDWWNLFNLN